MAETDPQLLADIASEEFTHYVTQGFWEWLETSGSLLYVRLFAADDRTYVMQLDCSSYGTEPIWGRFVEEGTYRCVPTAWPRGNATFEQWVKHEQMFICWDQDRGGLTHHTDWRALQAWKKKPNQIVAYLVFMISLLHTPAKGYTRLCNPQPA